MSVLAKGLWMWGFRRSVTVCGPRRSDEWDERSMRDPPAPQGLPIQMLLPCQCCQLSCEPGWPELRRLYLINDILRGLYTQFSLSLTLLCGSGTVPACISLLCKRGHKLSVSNFIIRHTYYRCRVSAALGVLWTRKKICIFSHFFPC